jgi:hypothetical protein
MFPCKAKVVGIDEFRQDEAYRLMMLVEEHKIRKEMQLEKNMGASMDLAFRRVLADHSHSALRGLVRKVVHEVYAHGS